jgi:hypothetical protein
VRSARVEQQQGGEEASNDELRVFERRRRTTRRRGDKVKRRRGDVSEGDDAMAQRQLASANGLTTITKDKDVVEDGAMRSSDVSGHAVRQRPSGRRWPVWPLDHATA